MLGVTGAAFVYGANHEGQCGGAPATLGAWLYQARELDLSTDAVPALAPGTAICAAATGAAHTLLVTADGDVYAAGNNAQGQCGLPRTTSVTPFRQLDAFLEDGDRAVDVACGRDFSLVVTAHGHGT